ncbi:unnamed protein product [Chrysoparadoxa australica]
MANRIEYSEKYQDDSHEYRLVPQKTRPGCRWELGESRAVVTHVVLPKELARNIPKSRCLSDSEWRGLGVQQSRGWVHYGIHKPEPHILLFKRPLGTNAQTGEVDPVAHQEAKAAYMEEIRDKLAQPLSM